MIGYERFNQVIAVSAADKDSINHRLVVKCRQFTVSYSNYVKSQVHLNISHDLGGLSLSTFVEALWYLKGKEEYRSSALKVLKQFYLDMAKFLIKNPIEIRLHVVIDVDIGCTEAVYNLASVQNEITRLCSGDYGQDLSKCNYSEIIDYVDDANDLLYKKCSYSVAAVLLNEIKIARQQEIRKVRFT